MPRVEWDLSINLGHVISILVFLGSAIAAWYSVQARISQVEYRVDQVEKRNVEQDATQDSLKRELTETIRDSNKEVKQEIRDLRTDLMRGLRK